MGQLKADTHALSGAGAGIKQAGESFGVAAQAAELALELASGEVSDPGLSSALESLLQSAQPIHRATYEGLVDVGSNVSKGSAAYQTVDQQLVTPEGATK